MEKFHTYTREVLTDKLKTDINSGLTSKNAKKRLSENGKNELLEGKSKGVVSKFIGQFNDFLIIILIISAVISFIVGIFQGESDITEPIIILTIVVLNASVGVFQEGRAEKSLKMLKKMSAPTALVLRDSKIIKIPATDVVVGDVLVFSTGDVISADARIITGVNILTDESSITGESNPVSKNPDAILDENTPLGDRCNMLFASTSVVSGHGRAVVTSIGMDTEVGRVAGLIVNSESPETPLQKRMADFGKKIGIIALIICGLVFLAGILSGYSFLEMFITSVSLAVAAIPEGLPAIVTIMLAIGVSDMAKHKALVRNLPSVETLGSADVICTDKTGTITENKMTVTEIFTEDESLLCLLGSLCCMKDTHNPTELAILKYSEEKIKNPEKYSMIKEIPFSSRLKKMTVLCKFGQSNKIISKGAIDVLLNSCTKYKNNKKEENLTISKKREILRTVEEMASSGLRIIGVTYKDTKEKEISENNMVFLGLFGIEDPPRKETYMAVEECRRAGIIPVMITGDHLNTALAIAKKTGIFEDGKKALTGNELDKMTDEELKENISDYRVFARVSPEHKMRIVKAWQENGKVVAMTGDGVNDAPALKCADIGCSLGLSGTDVAKAASDMVLCDDNFATVVEAVKHGRLIFKNIKKTIGFLLSSNTGEIVTIFVGMLLGFPPPLIAIQLLWVNLVTDSLPAIALGVDPENEDLMKSPPSDANLFTKDMAFNVVLEGLMIGMLALLAFSFGMFKFLDINIARTMAFCTLSISQLIHSFNMRSEKSIIGTRIFENRLLVFSAVLGITLQVLVTLIPYLSGIFKVTSLSGFQWLIVSLLSIMPVIVVEIQKYFNKKQRKI